MGYLQDRRRKGQEIFGGENSHASGLHGMAWNRFGNVSHARPRSLLPLASKTINTKGHHLIELAAS